MSRKFVSAIREGLKVSSLRMPAVLAASTLLFLLLVVSGAQGGQFTLSDDNSTVNIDSGSQAGVYSWIIDSYNHLNKQWWWYRVGSTPETSIDTIANQTFVLGTNYLDLVYTSQKFKITLSYDLTGGPFGSGASIISERIRIDNTQTAASLDFHLYEYTDFDLWSTPNNDITELVNSSTIKQTDADILFTDAVDGGITPIPNQWEIAAWPGILTRLNDGTLSNLLNMTTPSGPGNMTFAFQWNFTIGPRRSMIVSKSKIANLTPAAMGDYVWQDMNATVWQDMNANGIQDDGETGINDVTVNLFDCVGNLIDTTITADNTATGMAGWYQFANIFPGCYRVQFVNPGGGYEFSPALQGDDAANDSDPDPTGLTAEIYLGAGDYNQTIDAGLWKPSSIGDFVWDDLNGNGIQDEGEVGIPGVVVNLLDCQGTELSSTTTDELGLYLFANLRSGCYDVQFVNPGGGYVFTTGLTGQINLSAGENNLTTDAGLWKPSSIGDFVWNDLNGNGIQNEGEVGIPGVVVKLLDCQGSELSSTTTDESGLYLFANLSPGCYDVQFVNPGDGYVFSTGLTGQINLSAGENNLTTDAGLWKPSSIGDFVWNDLNGNGIQNDGELGIPGVVVKLLDCQGSELSSTTTDESGLYLFANMSPGCYDVQFVNPGDGYVFSTGLTGQINLDAGENNLTTDAGLWKPGSIGDLVWNDMNGNRIQDVGELGIPGVVVNLLDCLGIQISSTTTDGSGLYLFANLPPGCYDAIFVNPGGGYVFSTGLTGQINLGAGENNLTIDAGLWKLGSIGNSVWNDLNGNGIQDVEELGIPGVVVKLLDCQGNQISSMATDVSGLYLFADLPPGCYAVQFVNPGDGHAFSPALRGDDVTQDSNPDSSGLTGVINLGPGENNLTIDAGIWKLGTIGDFVWHDLDGNGIKNVGELGIPGVVVKLLDCQGNQISSATTDELGLYLFADLLPGCYNVQFVNPGGGYVFSPALQGGDVTQDSDPNSTGLTGAINLGAGENNLTIDGGLWKPTPGIAITKNSNKSMVGPGDLVTYTYVVKNTGNVLLSNVVVKDDNGTPGFLSDDFTVGTVASIAPGQSATFTTSLYLPQEMSMVVNTENMVVGTLITQVLPSGDIKVSYLQSRTLVDNTYGTGMSSGWSHHNFDDFLGSDKAQFKFTDSSGALVLDFIVDYISASANYPSGYGTLGVTGGDGNMVTGSALSVLSTSTTITENLNQSPAFYGFTTNSPAPESAYPTWNYVDGYTVVVSKSAFGTKGFGGVTVPLVHNSPSKLGFNATLPTQSSSCVTNRAEVTATANGQPVTASADKMVCIAAGPLGTIGNFVWNDRNGNSIQDAGELGIPDVTITYTGPGGLSDTLTTDANGAYSFTGLPSGKYTVCVDSATMPSDYMQFYDLDGVVTPNCATVTLAAGQNRTDLDFGYGVTPPSIELIKTSETECVTPGQLLTYTYTVTNTGPVDLTNVVVRDDNATPDYSGDDFLVGTLPTLAVGSSSTLTATTTVTPSTLSMVVNGESMAVGTLITQVLPSGDVKVIYLQNRNVVDNTYGTGISSGWSKHNFSDLVSSDMAEFKFTDSSGALVLDFLVDYISASTKYPSGHGTLGVTGGDGKMVKGSALSVLSASTTITENLNQSSAFYGFKTNSPAPESAYPTWNYVNGYTVVVSKSAFGTKGFGGVTIPLVHNSPSKIGCNAILPKRSGEVTNIATATAEYDGVVVTSVATESIPYCSQIEGDCQQSTSAVANFNHHKIYTGSTIWFNAVGKFGHNQSITSEIRFTNQTITFTASGEKYNILLPNTLVRFVPGVTMASTVYDSLLNSWVTTAPANYTGNVFLGGIPFAVPDGGLPDNIKKVKWSGDITSNDLTAKAQWKWAAAVYKEFSNDLNQIGVKPIDGDNMNPYMNNHHAGTPENYSYKNNVIGGAHGGGCGDWTGSHSGTAKLKLCIKSDHGSGH